MLNKCRYNPQLQTHTHVDSPPTPFTFPVKCVHNQNKQSYRTLGHAEHTLASKLVLFFTLLSRRHICRAFRRDFFFSSVSDVSPRGQPLILPKNISESDALALCSSEL